ncbi:probable low-specificity L-threonine aldolase 2 isoform X2 [Thrips palmi]|nr:probable low-specificity L-threonine aldolase 2 isoform X2 [Thrips palmi]
MYTVSENMKPDPQSCVIDLRSDTLTMPSMEMRKAMFEAEVGDDVLREDPTVNALQDKIAKILQKEAALFMSSGTLSNLIAVMAHCYKRGDKVLIGHKSHILQHEDGGVSELGGVMINTIPNNADGTFDLQLMEKNYCGGNISLVCIENTFGHGGSVLPLEFIDKIGSILSRKKIPLHCDGARLFNAAVYHKVPPARLVKDCASVSVCLSKGLGAPVGSLLVGNRDFIEKAFRLRHLLGGAMRQSGVLAAAGIVALDTGVARLVEDHERLHKLVTAMVNMKTSCLKLDVDLMHTNIAIIHVNPKCCTAKELVERLFEVTPEEEAEIGKAIRIKCYEIGVQEIRFVTWNAITDADIKNALEKLSYIVKELEKKMSASSSEI